MKVKGKCLFLVLILIILVSFPGVAIAQSDEYGYNAQARMFKGTLKNWEAFLSGSSPTPYDPNGTDIIFVQRKWNKLFDPMIHLEPPTGAGAWQKAQLWENYTGEKLGWTWHLNIELVYSPEVPIPGAIELPLEAVGFPGFYLVEQKEWLEGPNGEMTVIDDFSVNRGEVKRALHFGRKMP